MPHLSRAEMATYLRRRLLSSERWVAAKLEVRSHEGETLFTVGGCWDRQFKRYVDRPCTVRVYVLQESQLELGRALGRWLKQAQEADPKRRRVLMGGGNRGSGKTWLLAGVAYVAVALAFPGCIEYGINITVKQKRECLEAIREVCGEGWIVSDVNDLRDPRTEFLTGTVVNWMSAQNPRAIRSAGLPIRYICINEGQDQPEKIFINAVAALRNTGGLLGIATNPPTSSSGDWTAALWQAIEGDEVNGERYLLENRLNRAIDQDAVSDIGVLIRAVNKDAAAADADGTFKLSGNLAYPAFVPTLRERGGHIGGPDDLGWVDITREVTAEAIGGKVGFDFIVGVDWQKTPGIYGAICKLYRFDGKLVLHVVTPLAVPGVEGDFSAALYDAGYRPTPGAGGPSVVLIGDATGARQNAEHRWSQPPSYTAMKADGWITLPPMRHWKHGTPWNPLVRDSRAQMHAVLSARQILLSEECRMPGDGFASLVESFRRAKVGPRGGLVERGGFQHGPDSVRYVAWRFLPRPQMAKPAPVKKSFVNELRSIRVLGG